MEELSLAIGMVPLDLSEKLAEAGRSTSVSWMLQRLSVATVMTMFFEKIEL